MATEPQLKIFLQLIEELKSLVKFHPIWDFIMRLKFGNFIILRYLSNSYYFRIHEDNDERIIFVVKVFINHIEDENSAEFFLSISFGVNIKISQYHNYIDPLEGDEGDDEDDSLNKLLEITKYESQNSNGNVILDYWT
jgi:hypothetical protein